MNRNEFLASIFGGAVTVKMLEAEGQPIPDGGRPLVVFEVPDRLSEERRLRIRQEVEPYAKKHKFDFLVAHGGMTVKRVL